MLYGGKGRLNSALAQMVEVLRLSALCAPGFDWMLRNRSGRLRFETPVAPGFEAPVGTFWDVLESFGGLPGGTRTPDPQLRRLVLYPVELRAAGGRWMVGVAGFELATYWSQTSCATRLRYTPNNPDCTQRAAPTTEAGSGAGNINCCATAMHWRMCCSQTNFSAE